MIDQIVSLSVPFFGKVQLTHIVYTNNGGGDNMDFFYRIGIAVALVWLMMQALAIYKVDGRIANILAMVGFALIILWLFFILVIH